MWHCRKSLEFRVRNLCEYQLFHLLGDLESITNRLILLIDLESNTPQSPHQHNRDVNIYLKELLYKLNENLCKISSSSHACHITGLHSPLSPFVWVLSILWVQEVVRSKQPTNKQHGLHPLRHIHVSRMSRSSPSPFSSLLS